MKTTWRSARALACALAFAPFFCGADDQPPANNTDPSPPAVATDSVATPPTASQPAASQPAASQPAASQPAASQPAAAPPVATQPVVAPRAASQVATARPVATSAAKTPLTSTPIPPPPATKAVRAEVVMVDVWGRKFSVEHEGVVHRFNLERGGLLFYKGKVVTLKSLGIGQQVLLEVVPDRKGEWELWTASIVPKDEIKRSPEEAAKVSSKEARKLAKAEAKAKKRAEEEARAQAKAEA